VRYFQLYREWQRKAVALARALAGENHFHALHHLTMVGYREPGYLWTLTDIPFLWGPVGGYVNMPWRFLPMLGPRGMLRSSLRTILNTIQMRAAPRVRKAARQAKVIFAATSVDQEAILRFYGRRAVLLGETAADVPTCSAPRSPPSPGKPLRVGWSGRHLSTKALPLLLRALRLLPHHVSAELHILGDGPASARWRAAAQTLGVGHLCHFYGWRPRDEAIAVMQSFDVFAITSLQDATSSVLFEAMGAGLPILCHACCGFPDALTDECAILLPVDSPAASARGFAAAITRLFCEPGLYSRMSSAAIGRARSLSWRSRARVVVENYRSVIAKAIDPS
jgi:glycosyltransferase involved in cell wall biosynthesis